MTRFGLPRPAVPPGARLPGGTGQSTASVQSLQSVEDSRQVHHFLHQGAGMVASAVLFKTSSASAAALGSLGRTTS